MRFSICQRVLFIGVEYCDTRFLFRSGVFYGKIMIITGHYTELRERKIYIYQFRRFKWAGSLAGVANPCWLYGLWSGRCRLGGASWRPSPRSARTPSSACQGRDPGVSLLVIVVRRRRRPINGNTRPCHTMGRKENPTEPFHPSFDPARYTPIREFNNCHLRTIMPLIAPGSDKHHPSPLPYAPSHTHTHYLY